MDYSELIENLKNLETIAYGYNINGEVLGMDCSDFEQIMVDAADAIAELHQYKELGDLDRLRELVQADREGRAHILPSPRENTCGKCGNFTRTPGCGYGECTLRPGLRPYQSRAKCKRYTEKALEEMEGNENG